MAQNLNRLAKAYTITFATWESMMERLMDIHDKYEKDGYFGVLDLNPEEDSYLRHYGWRSFFPELLITRNHLSVRQKYEYLNLADDPVDKLEVRPEIIDILRENNVNTMDDFRHVVLHITDLNGIGRAYGTELLNAWDRYKLNSLEKGEDE